MDSAKLSRFCKALSVLGLIGCMFIAIGIPASSKQTIVILNIVLVRYSVSLLFDSLHLKEQSVVSNPHFIVSAILSLFGLVLFNVYIYLKSQRWIVIMFLEIGSILYSWQTFKIIKNQESKGIIT